MRRPQPGRQRTAPQPYRPAPAAGGRRGFERDDAAFDPRARVLGGQSIGGGGRSRRTRSFDIADAFQLGKYILVGLVALAIVVFVGRAVYYSTPATYEVEGQEVSLVRGTTYRDLLESGELVAVQGDLLAVDGAVLEEGGGDAPTVSVDGVQVDLDERITDEGNITAEDGADQIEPYTATQEITPVETKVARDMEAEDEGAAQNVFNFYNGVLHVVTDQGQEGITETRTGEVSGKTATVKVQDMRPRVFENLHPDLPSDQKLVALTFDDGPNPAEGGTDGILEVLADNDVKATFFMLGTQAEQYPEEAKKVADAGHEVASHSYSHDAEDFLNNDKTDKVREQVQKASEAIEAATGTVPKYVRPPGGNIDLKGILAADTLADGYIGWTLDTLDYELPGSDVIAQNIVDEVQPGSIVLMHDGGGDRSQTAEALAQAIPELKEEGYTFVTIDELVQAVIASNGSKTSDSGTAASGDEADGSSSAGS